MGGRLAPRQLPRAAAELSWAEGRPQGTGAGGGGMGGGDRPTWQEELPAVPRPGPHPEAWPGTSEATSWENQQLCWTEPEIPHRESTQPGRQQRLRGRLLDPQGPLGLDRWAVFTGETRQHQGHHWLPHPVCRMSGDAGMTEGSAPGQGGWDTSGSWPRSQAMVAAALDAPPSPAAPGRSPWGSVSRSGPCPRVTVHFYVDA